MNAKEFNDKIFNLVINTNSPKMAYSKASGVSDSAKNFEQELKTKMVVIPDPMADEYAGKPLSLEEMKAHIETKARVRSAAMGIKPIAPRSTNQSIARYFKSPIGVTIALLMLVGSLFFLFKNESKPTAPQLSSSTETKKPADIPSQNLFNVASGAFTELSNKTFEPEKYDDKKQADAYFKDQGVIYAVPELSLNGGKLSGAFVSELKGMKLANLVFKVGGGNVTLLAVPISTVQSGNPVYVTKEVLAKIDSNQKIYEVINNDDILVMFKTGDCVITAVTNASIDTAEKVFGK